CRDVRQVDRARTADSCAGKCFIIRRKQLITLGSDVGRSANPRKKAKKEKIVTADVRSRCECIPARSMKLPDLFSVISANLHVEPCSTFKLQPLTENTL